MLTNTSTTGSDGFTSSSTSHSFWHMHRCNWQRPATVNNNVRDLIHNFQKSTMPASAYTHVYDEVRVPGRFCPTFLILWADTQPESRMTTYMYDNTVWNDNDSTSSPQGVCQRPIWCRTSGGSWQGLSSVAPTAINKVRRNTKWSIWHGISVTIIYNVSKFTHHFRAYWKLPPPIFSISHLSQLSLLFYAAKLPRLNPGDILNENRRLVGQYTDLHALTI